MMKAKALEPIMEFVNNNLKSFIAVMRAFSGVIANVYRMILKVFNPAVEKGTTLTTKLVGFFNELASKSSFTEMFEMVADKVGNMFTNTFKTVYPLIIGFVRKFIAQFAAKAKEIIGPIVEAIKVAGPDIIKGLLEIFYVLEGAFLQALPLLVAGAVQILWGLLVNGIPILFKGIISALGELLSGEQGLAGFIGGLSLAIGVAFGIFKAFQILMVVVTTIQTVYNAIKAIELGLYGAIVVVVLALVACIALFILGLYGIYKAIEWVYENWETFVAYIKTGFEYLWLIIQGAVAVVIGALMAVPLAITAVVGGLIALVASIFGFGDDVEKIFTDMMDTILEGISNLFSWVGKKAEAAKEGAARIDNAKAKEQKVTDDKSYKKFASDKKAMGALVTSEGEIDSAAITTKAQDIAAQSGFTGAAADAYAKRIEAQLKADLKPVQEEKRKEAEERKKQEQFRKDQMKTNKGTRAANDKIIKEGLTSNITVNQAASDKQISFGAIGIS